MTRGPHSPSSSRVTSLTSFTMQLLVRGINRHFQKHHRQHGLADELTVNIERMRECFLGNTLPLPTAKVIAAWKDLPNVTVDKPSAPRKIELPFLQVPPPTPTGLAMDTEAPPSSVPSSNCSHDDDDWQFVDDTILTTPDVAAPRTLEGSTTGEDDAVSRYSYPDQSLDLQINEDDLLQSADSSSDQESLPSSGGCSPTPVGFHNMVNQWLLDYRARGTDAFIESLIAFGVISVGTALLASRIARAMVSKVTRVSDTEGQNLYNAIRFSVLGAFKKYWEVDGDWSEVPSAQTDLDTAPPTSYGINIASLMGSMFNEKISTAKDVHVCLSILSEGERRLDCLCAMHALLVQANDKLCKNRNLSALMQFRGGITSISRETGEYLWDTAPRAKIILSDILSIIERWMVSQASKRERSRMTAWTGHRIRNSAVGPRLRNVFQAGV